MTSCLVATTVRQVNNAEKLALLWHLANVQLVLELTPGAFGASGSHPFCYIVRKTNCCKQSTLYEFWNRLIWTATKKEGRQDQALLHSISKKYALLYCRLKDTIEANALDDWTIRFATFDPGNFQYLIHKCYAIGYTSTNIEKSAPFGMSFI